MVTSMCHISCGKCCIGFFNPTYMSDSRYVSKNICWYWLKFYQLASCMNIKYKSSDFLLVISENVRMGTWIQVADYYPFRRPKTNFVMTLFACLETCESTILLTSKEFRICLGNTFILRLHYTLNPIRCKWIYNCQWTGEIIWRQKSFKTWKLIGFQFLKMYLVKTNEYNIFPKRSKKTEGIVTHVIN